MAQIELSQVGLTFRVRTHGRISIKEYLLKGRFWNRSKNVMQVCALDDINLHMTDGDRVGIIGSNGAGKSTLLRVLAGVYPPTRGTRNVTGRIASLFEIALGFEMDANGWENIAFRGYFQGESPRSLRSKTADIAEFSELGDFMNMPLRYYSAGMLVRLAFSIATAIEPEILIVDEVLSAGDLSFQCKARNRISKLVNKARLVVLVSHDLQSIASMCQRVIWMDRGKMREVGPAERVIAGYQAYSSAPLEQAA